MKNKGLIALLLALTLLTTVLSVHLYNGYKADRVAAAEKQAFLRDANRNLQADTIRTLNGRVTLLTAERDKYRKQCAVGLVAYNLLTPIQKKDLLAPDCK